MNTNHNDNDITMADKMVMLRDVVTNDTTASDVWADTAYRIRGDPDPRSLSLGNWLRTNSGRREEILYQHRFSSVGKRKRFFDWFYSNAANDDLGHLDLLLAVERRAQLFRHFAAEVENSIPWVYERGSHHCLLHVFCTHILYTE